MSTGDFGGEWRRGTGSGAGTGTWRFVGALSVGLQALTRLLLLWHVRPTPGMFHYTKQGPRSSSLSTYV